MKNRFSLGQLFSMGCLALAALACLQCKHDPTPPDPEQPVYTTLDKTFGYGILSRVKGIWNGPLTSTTALGSFPEWIVDFRPISENQISAKNELDSINDIHLSFFIVKYNGEYRVCFRNGGGFNGMTRVSYFLADSVSETTTQAYYRFAEVIKGKSRAYTELVFRNDSLFFAAYTNKYNALATPTAHMSWAAKRQDTTVCQAAVAHFDFPKKTLTKDFTSTFAGQTEVIYYSVGGAGDPYTEAQQPYLGQSTINYTYGSGYTPSASKKVLLMITTEPLISGFSFNMANLKFRSRYVLVPANDQSFVFNYMHPGTYYLYAFYDADGNLTVNSGDWMSTSNTTFTLPELGTTTASTQINFTIP